MKKITFSVLLVLAVFFFSACSQGKEEKQSVPTTDRPFSSSISIAYKDLSYKANLTFRNSASATLEITSPENISGLIFTLSNDNLSARYEGLDFPLDTLDSRTKTAAGMLFSAIANAGASKNVKVDREKNEFSVSNKIYSYKYTMIFDKTSGAIKSFSVPDEELFISFSNFSFL